MGTPTELGTLLQLQCPNVYFQPPNGYRIKYPCIIYELNRIDTDYADNNPYLLKKRYTVTVIDADPNSDIVDKVAILSLVAFANSFQNDNLNHTVFDIYF